MQRVKVARYVSWHRPEYTPSDSDSSVDEEGFAPTREMGEGTDEEEVWEYEKGAEDEDGLDSHDGGFSDSRRDRQQTCEEGKEFN